MRVKEYTEQQLDELFTHFGAFDINGRNEIKYLMEWIKLVVTLYDKRMPLPNGCGVSVMMEYRNPKKPVVVTAFNFKNPYMSRLVVANCPTCGRRLRTKIVRKNDKFCPSCGQAIDWTGI